jgi:GH15 family glucan-1,4-alpha-glucosidase
MRARPSPPATDARGGSEVPRYVPIGDYALIGDCHACALVSKQGAIDWACLARFDAGSVFGRILDADKGGTFAITAREQTGHTRRYLSDTNVLETTFTTRTGSARLLDCFTMREGGRQHPHRQLLRVVEGIEGEVSFDVLVMPRFDYGSLRPWLRYYPERRLHTAVGGDDAFVLSAECHLELALDDTTLRGQVTVGRRQRRRFSLVSHRPHELRLVRPSARTLDERLRGTIAWWRRWVRKGRYAPAYRDQVVRSALLLKLLTCAPTGAIIAAPTASLPESPGGPRNWDYRFCWIRDATYTLSALLELGHTRVASGFKLFIERATAGHADDLQIVYGCYGERRLTELEVPGLEGYLGSRPVRVGNGAAVQSQLDVYGELLEAAHLWRRAGNPIGEDNWRFLCSLVDAACAKWKEPDRGLWEVRGPPRHFVHSKVMCWVAVQRGIEAAEQDGHPCDVGRWRAAREEMRTTIEREGVDRRRKCFVQAFGSSEVDASLLLLPIVGFVSPNDPRMLATVERIREELCLDGLVRRYRPERVEDGLEGGEGAFLMCSFWLVDVLAMQGKLAEAEDRFRSLLELCNDVGLFAEQYAPRERQFLGNFPQAFTHMALVNSAAQLRRAHAGADHASPLADRSRVRPRARRNSRG